MKNKVILAFMVATMTIGCITGCNTDADETEKVMSESEFDSIPDESQNETIITDTELNEETENDTEDIVIESETEVVEPTTESEEAKDTEDTVSSNVDSDTDSNLHEEEQILSEEQAPSAEERPGDAMDNSAEKTDSETNEDNQIELTDALIADVKKRNEVYRFYLENEYWGGGCAATFFSVVDYDGDGMEELAVQTNSSRDGFSSALLSWKDGRAVWCEDIWVSSAIFYCPETNCFMTKQGIPFEYTSPAPDMGSSITAIWKIDASKESGRVHLFSVNGDGYGHYVELQEGEDRVYTEEETAQVNATIEQYMPSAILVESTMENTPENRDKYLPIDEDSIRTLIEAKVTE